MNTARILPFARLLRLPNVFTAFADTGLAACAAGYISNQIGVFVLMLLGSGCLYLAGMVWNDFFDRHDDAKTQSFRPIPSGQLTPRFAALVAIILMASGVTALATASGAARNTIWLTVALVAMILLYNRLFKHFWLGPIAMGICRFLNLLVGLSVGEVAFDTPFPYHLGGIIGLYIVGVTWFSRAEESTSQRWQLIGGAIVMALALLLAATLPGHLEPGNATVFFPYLCAVFGFGIGFPIISGIRRPSSSNVQFAIKRCILGLIFFDSILATLFIGWYGLLFLLLLLPAILLGKWVYST
jgi:hypothetical protein